MSEPILTEDEQCAALFDEIARRFVEDPYHREKVDALIVHWLKRINEAQEDVINKTVRLSYVDAVAMGIFEAFTCSEVQGWINEFRGTYPEICSLKVAEK